MKKELIDILACPICKSTLKLEITQEVDQEIVTGSLQCASCEEIYPIDNSIPNLLPPQLRES